MLAVQFSETGAPDVLHLVEQPRPAPIPTEILVRVHAAGVNPVDWKTRAGEGVHGLQGDGPWVPGWDVSGVVEEVGYGVTTFAPGDEVFGMPRFPHPARAYAEYVTAPSRHFARKPSSVSHEAAAGLPLAGLTAWQALIDTASIQPGQRVLIHAAAGGVGHLAVQLAASRGAHVIGTASARNAEFVRSLGAAEVIDYTSTPFEEATGDIDVVVDLIGHDYAERSLAVLRDGGLLIEIPSSTDLPDESQLTARGLRATGMLVEPDHTALGELAQLVDSGQLRVEVGTVMPLAAAADIHRLGENGRTRGKLVLTI